MPVGQHEAVAVGPVGIGRVESHDPAEQHVGQRGERHGGALVAALGVQWGVHRHAADERDRLLLLLGGQGESHRGGLYPGGGQATGGSRVNGTIVHGPRSMRQWANTWP